MVPTSKMNSDFMSIRSWLRLASAGLIVIALLSGAVLWQIATDVQIHADLLRQSKRLQTLNAELSSDVTYAWLQLHSGDASAAAPALAELRHHKSALSSVMQAFSSLSESSPHSEDIHQRANWHRLRERLDDLVVASEALAAKSADGGLSAPAVSSLAAPLDKPVFTSFKNVLRETISTSRFSGARSFTSVRWVLRNLCVMTLALITGLTIYGLFFFLFVGYRIGTRTADVTNRILRYTTMAGSENAPSPAAPIGAAGGSIEDDSGVVCGLPRDEFGTIEERIDECAQAVLGQQMMAADQHAKTLKQLEARTEELGNLNDALRASGRALVRFLTDVSHDLRTPLAIMVGESEVSLRSQSTSIEDYKETLARMLDQTRYLGSLVDQLLYTARSRVSAVPVEPAYIDVSELVTSSCRDMKTLADNRQITIELADNLDGAIVMGDRTRLREMVLTILDNAIEYSKPHSTIVVTLSRQTGNLTIAVADSGIGIPADELPMIFRRFYRAHNAPDASAKGTGIGLAIAKGIVESHDGSIEIDSLVDKGTTVTIVLPLVDKRKCKRQGQVAKNDEIAERAGDAGMTIP